MICEQCRKAATRRLFQAEYLLLLRVQKNCLHRQTKNTKPVEIATNPFLRLEAKEP